MKTLSPNYALSHPEAPGESAPPLILVVDDDRSSLRLLAGILGEKGYEIIFGVCGADTFELVGQRPELILLDYHLPDMDGLEVCRRLKADPDTAQIPVIFLTANQDPELEAAGLQSGAVDFVTKPYSAAVLRARVNTHIALNRKTALLEALSHQDGLTRVANRRFFDATLQQEWARGQRNRAELGLVMIDIDHFKAVNDTWGHQEGDDCLRHLVGFVARHLKRPADLLARYGGEEFVLLLPETSLDGAVALAECVRGEIESGFARLADERGTGPRATASFGCASRVPSDEVAPGDLLLEADRNLYLAKAQGRNQVQPVLPDAAGLSNED